MQYLKAIDTARTLLTKQAKKLNRILQNNKMSKKLKTRLFLEESTFSPTAMSSTPRVFLDGSASSSGIMSSIPRKLSWDYSGISRQDSQSTDDTADDRDVAIASANNVADKETKDSAIHLPNKVWLQILD